MVLAHYVSDRPWGQLVELMKNKIYEKVFIYYMLEVALIK
jgi:hypothetical protein